MNQYRVVASCFLSESDKPSQRRRVLREHMTALLEEQRPDLLVLPEKVVAAGLGVNENFGAEPVDGPTLAIAAELAVEFSANMCVPIVENDQGKLYNTAIYLDRCGKVAGVYRKRVPTTGESAAGFCAGGGDQQPVLLDGLRIGTAICYDGNYPNQVWDWIAAGVDLLTFPSYTYAGEMMRSWAVNCGVPLICAFPWESVIFDRNGSTLVKGGTWTPTIAFGHHQPWIACTLAFNSRIYHLDDNQERLQEITSQYGAQVDVQLMIREGRMMLTSTADNINLNMLETEFGLIPIQAYLRDSLAKVVS